MEEYLSGEKCNGVMGVPITFLDKYNPEQFEILGITDRDEDNPYRTHLYNKDEYKNANDLNRRACIVEKEMPKALYARMLIRYTKTWIASHSEQGEAYEHRVEN